MTGEKSGRGSNGDVDCKVTWEGGQGKAECVSRGNWMYKFDASTRNHDDVMIKISLSVYIGETEICPFTKIFGAKMYVHVIS